MTLYVRKIGCVAEDQGKRVPCIVEELTDDANSDELSVYAVDDAGAEIAMVAALYSAGRRFQKGFGYVLIQGEVLSSLGAKAVPDPTGSLFQWLRTRHHLISGLRDPYSLATAINETAKSVSRKRVGKLVHDERARPTVTTATEWEAAASWTAEV